MRAEILPLVVATCLMACEDSVAGQAAPPPQEVGVVQLKTQPVPVVATLPGRTRAYKVSQVRPQITGIIQERLFEEGAQVDAGQVLYTTDAAPYDAAPPLSLIHMRLRRRTPLCNSLFSPYPSSHSQH